MLLSLCTISVMLIVQSFPHTCLSNVFQGIPEILRLGLCPAMLTPSKPCELDLCPSIHRSGKFWPPFDFYRFFYFPSVTRRCFPALGEKGGVITVGNNSHFDDGSGNMRDAKDLVDGVKWVYHRMILFCQHAALDLPDEEVNSAESDKHAGISLQECHCGYWGSSGGHENLWGLHTVLVLDPDVSHSPAFVHLPPAFCFHFDPACLQTKWNVPPLLTPSPLSSGLVIAMLTSLLFIILLRFLAGIMVWVMIVLVILVIGYGKGQNMQGLVVVFVIVTSKWVQHSRGLFQNAGLTNCITTNSVYQLHTIYKMYSVYFCVLNKQHQTIWAECFPEM